MLYTFIIIIITVLVSMASWKNPVLQQKLIMNPYALIHRKQYYRLITSGFIHANWFHLIFNMVTFYFFGELIEQLYNNILGLNGRLYYIGLYLLGIIISNIPSVLKYKKMPHYNSLGASGGVTAIVFSSILFLPTDLICLYGILCIPGFIMGTIYLIYSYYKGKQMSGNINHDAHLTGAIFGIIYSVFIDTSVLINFFEKVVNYRFF